MQVVVVVVGGGIYCGAGGVDVGCGARGGGGVGVLDGCEGHGRFLSNSCQCKTLCLNHMCPAG